MAPLDGPISIAEIAEIAADIREHEMRQAIAEVMRALPREDDRREELNRALRPWGLCVRKLPNWRDVPQLEPGIGHNSRGMWQ